jgi:hypothetical protein
MAIGPQENALPFVVEAKRSYTAFFETIAAFDCRLAAEGYADECREANPNNQYRVTVPCPYIEHASIVERRIVGRLVEALLAAGYSLGVNDGEERTITNSKDADAIYKALASTDSDTLIAHFPDSDREAGVLLIWGNDVDVISDYHTSLEPVLAPINDWIGNVVEG